MKEFGPVNQDRLTTQAHASKLERRGDIFMPEGTANGPEQSQLPQPSLSEQRGRVNPRRIDPEKAARVQELFASLNRPGENASLAERRSYEMAQRAIMENFGIASVSGASRIIDVTGVSDAKILNEIDIADVLTQASGGAIDVNLIRETIEKVMRLEGASKDEKDLVTERLAELQRRAMADLRAQGQRQPERGSSIRLYLEQKDIDVIEVSPMTWLDSKFDMIYQLVDQGRELDSPQIKQLEQMFTVGANYISTYVSDLPNMTPDLIKEFITTFNTRLNLIFLRSAIEHRNMESVKQATERLQAHGLFTALSMESGNVNRMFSRMAEFLEDKRLAQEGILQQISRLGNSREDEKARSELFAAAKEFHITPEMMSRLQDDLISEQLSLAERGAGQYEDIFNTANTAIQAREGEIRRDLEAEGRSSEEIEREINNLIKAEARKNAEPQVRRSIRTAYDVLTVSQRQGVIVARGHRLPGPVENYLSDPSGLFNVFNYEDLLTEKFNIFNKPAAEFLREIKRQMALSKLPKLGIDPKSLRDEELLDYGKRMFRDLFAVPDFFSSGWRIKGITVAIERRIEADNPALTKEQVDEKVKDFGLFLQLKSVGRTEDRNGNETKEVWRRIAEIRPEEIVRLYRERAAGNTALTAQMERFFEGEAFRDFRIGPNGERLDAFKTYDKFKKEFGPLVQVLRQQGYDHFFSDPEGEHFDPKALRIGQKGFDEAQIKQIIRYFKKDELSDEENEVIGRQKAEQLQKMFANLTRVAREDSETIGIEKRNVGGMEAKFVTGKRGAIIYELMANDKFEDIYTRTLLVDDALLDKLENPPPGSGITPLSKYWTSEVGGDALVRNYKDLDNAAKAAGKLLNFIYTEDPKERIKAAEEFADLTSQYYGQGERAECIRYTVGSLLDMSKQDFIWDALGISKLPFRQAMSKIEKIYGPQAKPMSRDEIRVHVDNIHSMMVASIDRINKTPKQIKEKEFEVEATYRELQKLLEIDPKNMLKRRAASFLIYLILATVLEAGLLGKSVTKEK